MLNGRSPRDIIEYSLLVDEPDLELVVRRRGCAEVFTLMVTKEVGEPFGAEVSSAVFDRVRTCYNHCEFCLSISCPRACGVACRSRMTTTASPSSTGTSPR